MELNDENVDDEIKEFIKTQTDIKIDSYSDVGCNGELYFGQHKIFGERVALKFYYTDKKGLSHKEPQILRSIDHPNIIKVYDAKIISENYAYFLTSEYSGGDLLKFMKTNDLSTHQSISIIQDILKGVSEMHKSPNRLLHRDLKPNNILINNITYTACIADFGSIKYLQKNQTSLIASKNSLIYRPKETVDKNEYNFQSDIYQIGLVLFQLLGGFFPNASADWLTNKQKIKLQNISNIFEQHQYLENTFDKLISKNKLLRFESLSFYIDDKLKGIIRKATRPELSRRYKSASEFMNALYRYKANSFDWLDSDESFIATKKNETTYRIFNTKKGYCVEKKIKGGITRQMRNHDKTIPGIIEAIKHD